MNSPEKPNFKLEYDSERFAKKLFKRFPLWKQFTSHYMKGEPDNISYYLEVLIPPINPKVSDPLSIVTYPRQVIISWIGGSHRHFDSWPIQPYPFYMEKAIEFVEAIVADKIIFGYYEHGGEPTGAGFCSHVTTNNPPVKVETAQVGSVIIRSWLGAHDRELHDFPI